MIPEYVWVQSLEDFRAVRFGFVDLVEWYSTFHFGNTSARNMEQSTRELLVFPECDGVVSGWKPLGRLRVTLRTGSVRGQDKNTAVELTHDVLLPDAEYVLLNPAVREALVLTD